MPLAAIPVFVWLVTSLGTFLPGWLIVRWLPMWASIPLMVVLAGAMSAVALFMIAMAVPGDSKAGKWKENYYGIMLAVACVSPTLITIQLFRWFA